MRCKVLQRALAAAVCRLLEGSPGMCIASCCKLVLAHKRSDVLVGITDTVTLLMGRHVQVCAHATKPINVYSCTL